MRTLGRAIGAFTLLCLVTSSADVHAQAPTGNEFIVNAYTTEDQLHSSLAMGPDGGFLVFWDSWQNDGSYQGVFGRRFDAAGTPVGGDFQVNQFTTLAQSGPTAAPGADGGFIVAWQSETQDGDRFGIFGRRYDANGDKANALLCVGRIQDLTKAALTVPNASLADALLKAACPDIPR